MKKILLFLLMACSASAMAQKDTVGQMKMRTLYIFNMLKHIHFPDETFREYSIGIWGDYPELQKELELMTKTKKMYSKPIVIVPITNETNASQLQMVVTREKKELCEVALERMKMLPIVLVTENFDLEDTMFDFGEENDKVVFDMNVKRMHAVNLKASVQLESMARKVIDGTSRKE